MALWLAGVGLGLQALGGLSNMSAKKKAAGEQRRLSEMSAKNFLSQSGFTFKTGALPEGYTGFNSGVSKFITRKGGSFEETGSGAFAQLRRKGTEFMGQARHAAGLSGAGAGGSIANSLMESEKLVKQELGDYKKNVLAQYEQILAGGEAQASAMSPGLGDALSFAGGLFQGAYKIGALTGLPRKVSGTQDMLSNSYYDTIGGYR